MGDGVVLSETLACNLAIKCRQIPENNWLRNVDSVGQNDIRAFTGIQVFKFFVLFPVGLEVVWSYFMVQK